MPKDSSALERVVAPKPVTEGEKENGMVKQEQR